MFKFRSMKVMLFSGGLDSVIQSRFIEPDILLYVKMHTKPMKKELAALEKLPKWYKDRLVITKSINLSQFENSVFTIPYRNLILILIALQYGNEVYVGFNADESMDDKNPMFIKQANEFLTRRFKRKIHLPDAYQGGKIKVIAPFEHVSKSDMVKRFLHKFPDQVKFIQKLYTCYRPDAVKGCGFCDPCIKKAIALKENGIYADRFFDSPVTDKDIKDFFELNEKLKRNDSADI